MSIFLVLLLAIVFNAGANILIKSAVSKNPVILEQGAMVQSLFQAAKNPHLLAGVLFFGLALAAYSAVLSRINLSVAYPVMTGAGFLLVFLASAICFKESITAPHILGAGLILAGVWVLTK